MRMSLEERRRRLDVLDLLLLLASEVLDDDDELMERPMARFSLHNLRRLSSHTTDWLRKTSSLVASMPTSARKRFSVFTFTDK